MLEPDGVIKVNERTLILPCCRQILLKKLHEGHLGRDKMKSLSRLLCWWPSLNQDIVTFTKECRQCQLKPRSHANWKPWPVPFATIQRSSSSTADFTKEVLQRFFAREGIAQVLVTDNGSHFTAEHLQSWLRSIGCYSITTAPRHPQSNGLAENFIRSLKTAIRVNSPNNLTDLRNCIDNFLMQYRNAAHSTTSKSPALLFKGRNLRTSANLNTN
jgi:hypothetical protein